MLVKRVSKQTLRRSRMSNTGFCKLKSFAIVIRGAKKEGRGEGRRKGWLLVPSPPLSLAVSRSAHDVDTVPGSTARRVGSSVARPDEDGGIVAIVTDNDFVDAANARNVRRPLKARSFPGAGCAYSQRYLCLCA